jgi:hypothetical protein
MVYDYILLWNPSDRNTYTGYLSEYYNYCDQSCLSTLNLKYRLCNRVSCTAGVPALSAKDAKAVPITTTAAGSK